MNMEFLDETGFEEKAKDAANKMKKYQQEVEEHIKELLETAEKGEEEINKKGFYHKKTIFSWSIIQFIKNKRRFKKGLPIK
jgi:hypothetical protein